MKHWMEMIIIGVLLAWAIIYVVRAFVKKFKAPGCGDSCSCGPKKLLKSQARHKAWFQR